MTTQAMTDTELQEWLVDLDCGCEPTKEAFLRLARRCVEAEAKLTRAEAVHVGWQREVLQEVAR